MNSRQTTAILVFSRHAEEEAREKRYSKLVGRKGATALAGSLITHTLQQARATGLAVIPIFSDQQKGISFGERLTHAIDSSFALGFSNIIITGTDSPTVSSDQLLNVGVQLLNHQLVLVPASDGGVCLIGITRAAYHKEDLVHLRWLTDSVLTSLKAYAQRHRINVAVEHSAEDFDSVDAVLEWQAGNGKHWLSLLLIHLRKVWILLRWSPLAAPIPSLFFSHTSGLRGPPGLA